MIEPEEAAARAALAAFGIVPLRLSPPARSENITFRVDDAAGAYSLRLHRPGYHSLEELDAEREWTRALASAGFAVPEGVMTPDGRNYVAVAMGDEIRQAGLTRWIPGEVIGAEAGGRPEVFARLGEIAADLHAHSVVWRAPAGFTRHHLDADGLMGEVPFWGEFWAHAGLTPGEQALLARTREGLHAALARLSRRPEDFGMIHADLHPGNLLVDDGALTVIDFDDAAFGWYLYDLAVALNHHQGAENFTDLQAALLAGYRTRRPLSAEAEARLPMFLLVRRLAIIGWLHQRPEIDAAAHIAATKSLTCALCEAYLAAD